MNSLVRLIKVLSVCLTISSLAHANALNCEEQRIVAAKSDSELSHLFAGQVIGRCELGYATRGHGNNTYGSYWIQRQSSGFMARHTDYGRSSPNAFLLSDESQRQIAAQKTILELRRRLIDCACD